MKTAIYCSHTLPNAVYDERINEHGIDAICVIGECTATLDALKAAHVLWAHGITIYLCGFDEVPYHAYMDICSKCEAKLKGECDD